MKCGVNYATEFVAISTFPQRSMNTHLIIFKRAHIQVVLMENVILYMFLYTENITQACGYGLHYKCRKRINHSIEKNVPATFSMIKILFNHYFFLLINFFTLLINLKK